MQIFNMYKNLPLEASGAVVAIGNFDGVHRGHQALLAQAAATAKQTGRKLAVLTFEPHPKRLFRPDEPPGRLTPPSLKAWRLEQSGVEFLYSLAFDWDFASQSAGDFIQKILKDGLKASHIVVGDNFRFGQLRKGEAKDIEAAGIPVTSVAGVADENGQIYSSSLIRDALRQGDIAAANSMLGWEWEMRGEVIKGDQRGRELGFPTANFPLGQTIHPAYGVYAARVNIEGEKEWRGAAVNIGIRPMFEIPEAEVESHIFDFNREIYGKILRVQPVKRLRSEAKFNSLEELKAQMEDDCKQVQKILNQ
ncbi:MAG: bifunctional riboflavin kinase/FAD synthetase [Alphaproteobacteria bacterium PRO2]|nr:bifunctional riboflavin kinase/FAD synthetase [Alphaproteobacteria bacterium PRO2]